MSPASVQTATQGPPPAPPAADVPATAVVAGPAAGVISAVPATRDEVAALRQQRSELSRQLTSAVNRRDNLVKDMEQASGTNRAGVEARVKLLDQRILEIETDIANTGRLLTQTPGHLLTSSTVAPRLGPLGSVRMDYTAISVVFTLFVLMPIAVSMARLIWRRASAPRPAPTFDRESHERLQRLESSVDAIAIEMERVSEGQRFVTKLLAESRERERIPSPRT